MIGAEPDPRWPGAVRPHAGARTNLEQCGPEDVDGDVRDRIQTNGLCESANERGDTYGPVSYLAYVPATAIFGWSGKWDSLPAAHATSIAFDLLTVLGLVLVGLRFGGAPLAAALAFAWAAYPFTAYTLNANTNDAIMPAFLVWGFWLASLPAARGAAVALAGWTKFGALLLAPLWAGYPALTGRSLARFGAAFLGVDAARVLGAAAGAEPVGRHRDVLGADARLPARARLAVLALGMGSVPRGGDSRSRLPAAGGRRRRRSLSRSSSASSRGSRRPVQLAALTAAVLVAFELSLSHWFYLYLPWFAPFVALWLLLPEDALPVERADDRVRGPRLDAVGGEERCTEVARP